MSWAPTSTWGAPQPQQQQPQPQPGVSGPLTAQQLVNSIEAQANSQSPQYRFRWAFYNKIDEQNKVGKPSKMPDAMYSVAMEQNPNRGSLTPVLAEGFKDLKVRLEAQHKAQQDHRTAIESIKTYIEDLKQTHTLDVTVSLEDYKAKQMAVASRVLNLMVRLELLRHKQQSIQRGEEQFRTQIENIQRELNQPDQYKSRLSEVVSRVRMQEDRGTSAYPELDEEDQLQICKVLQEAGSGLAALVTDLKKDSEAVALILDKYRESVAALGHI
eukprot:TRINITY_DN16732_c0_g1_i1.p1 TRINITY_DN16732_c0_g1~~TRINITY_DN16732_c0_g1_i1.p1  ORF type:complete len:271 (-),score=57.54 TRINITY_DN16732_c0_g1_i1:62-874(-)